MKKLFQFLVLLLFAPAVFGQIVILERSHSAAGLVSGESLIENGSFEGVHQIMRTYQTWDTEQATPGWRLEHDGTSAIVGPILGNSFPKRLLSPKSAIRGSEANSEFDMNVSRADEGDNLLYLAVPLGITSSLRNPIFNTRTGDFWPIGSDAPATREAPTSISQRIFVEKGKKYCFEFWLTGGGSAAGGFVQLDLGGHRFWYTVPGSGLDHFDTPDRYFQILFQADSSIHIDTRFTSYGPINAHGMNSPAWMEWFGGSPGTPAVFIDDVKCVERSTLLPASMISLDAQRTNFQTVLEWQTAFESKTDVFRVQHSLDGENFEDVGLIKGQGNSSRKTEYKFEHAVVSIGDRRPYFYRVIEEKFDGSFELSPVLMVGSAKRDLSTILVYPNPMSLAERDNFVVELDPRYEIDQIRLLDKRGVLVSTIHNRDGQSIINVNTSNLVPGVYIVQAGEAIEKIIIQP